MKLSYTVVLLLGLIQCSFAKSSITTLQNLVEYYNAELNNISQDYCAKIKIVLEKLLQDDVIKQASTPTIRKFQEDVKELLEKYSNYARDNRYHELATMFNDITIKTDRDFGHIFKTLHKFDLQDIFNNYTVKYVNLVRNKFIPKFEEYWQQLTAENKKQQYFIMSWFMVLKNCKQYLCFERYFSKFPKVVKTVM